MTSRKGHSNTMKTRWDLQHGTTTHQCCVNCTGSSLVSGRENSQFHKNTLRSCVTSDIESAEHETCEKHHRHTYNLETCCKNRGSMETQQISGLDKQEWCLETKVIFIWLVFIHLVWSLEGTVGVGGGV